MTTSSWAPLRWWPFSWIVLGLSTFVRLVSAAWSDRALRWVFGVVLLVDIAWILWFGVAKYLLEAEITEELYDIKYLRITKEGSWPERYNYLKTLVLALLLGWLAFSARRLVYGAFAIVFAVVLLDDAVAIHETFGGYLVREFDIEPMLGVRAQDVGEVITWLLLGAILGPLLLVGLLRARETHRSNGMALLVAFTALVFCAIFVDQLYHSYQDMFFGAGILLDMIEDGGEMIAITAACLLAAVLVRHGPAAAERGRPMVDAAEGPPA